MEGTIIYLIILVLGLVGLILSGAPIAFGIITISAISLWLGHVNMQLLSFTIISSFDDWTWLAIPLFVMTGYLMNGSGISDRLISFSRSVLGHLPGGTAHIVVGTNTLMAGISGSMMADLAATGVIFIPAMKKEGYPADFAAAIVGTSSMIGPLIPPSIAFVIYGVMTGVSIGRLFVGGTVPGLLIAIFLLIYISFISKRRGYPSYPRASLGMAVNAFWKALPALFLPIAIIGGMRLGLYTPTEAGGMAVVYVSIIGLLVYRELSGKKFLGALNDTIELSIAIVFIIAASSLLHKVLVYLALINPVVAMVYNLVHSPFLFFILTAALCLILGFILDVTVIIVLLSPVLSIAAAAMGIDAIHYGVVFVFCALIGALTPPYAIGMFALLRLADITIGEYTRAILPCLIILVFIAFLLIIFPQLCYFLPNLIFGAM